MEGWAFRNDADLCGGIQRLPEGQVASCQRVFSLVLLLALYVQMLLSHLNHDVALPSAWTSPFLGDSGSFAQTDAGLELSS